MQPVLFGDLRESMVKIEDRLHKCGVTPIHSEVIGMCLLTTSKGHVQIMKEGKTGKMHLESRNLLCH